MADGPGPPAIAVPRLGRKARGRYRSTWTNGGVALPSPQTVIRAAGPADAEQVAAIFAHYVATSVATFEEVAPSSATVC